MTSAEFREYWRTKTSSMNREDSEGYYLRKAREHILVMRRHGPDAPVVDYGCGAGELLSRFVADYAARISGVDFSTSLLERARLALCDTGIELIEADAVDYATKACVTRWMSCGAVNQYSDREGILGFLDAFVDNRSVQQLFLFDTIDPIRLALLRDGVVDSYIPGRRHPSLAKKVMRATRGVAISLRIALGAAPVIPVGSMGFGIKPGFWLDWAFEHSVGVTIIGSVEFEYRYHVILDKGDAPDV